MKKRRNILLLIFITEVIFFQLFVCKQLNSDILLAKTPFIVHYNHGSKEITYLYPPVNASHQKQKASADAHIVLLAQIENNNRPLYTINQPLTESEYFFQKNLLSVCLKTDNIDKINDGLNSFLVQFMRC